MAIKVMYSKSFLDEMKKLSDGELLLIGEFVSSLQKSGFEGLPGRNKPSTGVSKKHVNREKLIQYAIEKLLWHYHVGYAEYDKKRTFGDWTSEYVVHYQNKESEVRFVSYGSHPPFKLPPFSSLT